MICTCPAGAEITDISLPDCLIDFGEIQRLFVQRVYSTGSTKNTFLVATADPTLLASWTPLLAAADGTKIQQTPFIDGLEPGGGEARTVGGPGESVGGTEIVKGSTPTTMAGTFSELPQHIARQLRLLSCEIIGLYLVNEYGQIGALTDKTDGTTPLNYYPIPVAKRTWFVGDLQFGGYTNRDGNAVQFSFLPNWSDSFQVITPSDFDPRENLT